MYGAARKPQQQAPHTAYQVDFVAVNCGKVSFLSDDAIRQTVSLIEDDRSVMSATSRLSSRRSVRLGSDMATVTLRRLRMERLARIAVDRSMKFWSSGASPPGSRR